MHMQVEKNKETKGRPTYESGEDWTYDILKESTESYLVSLLLMMACFVQILKKTKLPWKH